MCCVFCFFSDDSLAMFADFFDPHATIISRILLFPPAWRWRRLQWTTGPKNHHDVSVHIAKMASDYISASSFALCVLVTHKRTNEFIAQTNLSHKRTHLSFACKTKTSVSDSQDQQCAANASFSLTLAATRSPWSTVHSDAVSDIDRATRRG